MRIKKTTVPNMVVFINGLRLWTVPDCIVKMARDVAMKCGIVRPHILCLVFVLQDGIFLLKRNLKRCLKLLAENPLLEKNLRARRDGKRLFMTLMARMILVFLQFLLEAEEVMDLMDNWVLMETCGLLQKTSSRVHMVFSCLVRKIRQKLRDLILV